MPDVSLITSLYKTEKFLPQFAHHARKVAAGVAQHGIELEFVIVPNDASPTERAILEALKNDLYESEAAQVQINYVPLETLHASWNRGAKAANSSLLGFWNVDDIRSVDGIVEGYLLHQRVGYDLIDFPVEFHYVQSGKTDDIRLMPPQYNPTVIHPRNVTGAFFMYTGDLFNRAGDFDEGFPIVGDFEWCMRETVRNAKIGYGTQTAGQFFLHGGNITQASGLTDWVAFNVALLRHGAYENLRPVDPDSMQQAWDSWGDDGTPVPDSIKVWLWGEGARERFERFQWERNLPQLMRRGFLALAKRGYVKSVDWGLHHAGG